MGHPIRLGRLFGIELRIDPSWLFIFLLVSWSLTSLFASWHPDWALGTSLVVAVVTALLFFVSVLLHELSHSVVARMYGIPVRHITLHLFGGVANIEKEPPSPGAELWMAIVGPLASIGIGVVCMLLASAATSFEPTDVDSAATALSQLGPVETAIVWLGPVNIIVGLFNLIPGFPLDGGRILRAIVWKATGSLAKATRVAGVSGETVGWLLVAAGVVTALGFQLPFFGRGLASGIWLVLIGLFLRGAAVAHLRGAALDEALHGVHVADLMRLHGPVIAADVPLRALVEEWFMRRDDPGYPVAEPSSGVFVGLVTVEDVRRAGAATSASIWDHPLLTRDVMTPLANLVVTSPGEDLASALKKLGASDVRQLPVLGADGQLVGLLCEKDVARWLELRSATTRPTGRPATVGV
jgi:Zn-dependent protease